MRSRLRPAASLLASSLLLGASTAGAAVVWDESLNGDLANSAATATNLLVLNSGDNRVVGSVGTGTSSDNAEYAVFVVPEGQSLSQVVLESYVDGSFYDFAPFELYSGATTSAPKIEFINWGESDNGTDLLQFDSAPGSQPAGTYLFRLGSIVQGVANSEKSSYTINFRLTPVPEPSCSILASAAGALALLRRRRGN